MCGVPYHAGRQLYRQAASHQGYKVAICDQLEDPAYGQGPCEARASSASSRPARLRTTPCLDDRPGQLHLRRLHGRGGRGRRGLLRRLDGRVLRRGLRREAARQLHRKRAGPLRAQGGTALPPGGETPAGCSGSSSQTCSAACGASARTSSSDPDATVRARCLPPVRLRQRLRNKLLGRRRRGVGRAPAARLLAYAGGHPAQRPGLHPATLDVIDGRQATWSSTTPPAAAWS